MKIDTRSPYEGIPRWPGLRVRFGSDRLEWPVEQVDDQRFMVMGCAVPAGSFVPVTFILSPYLSVTVFAQAMSGSSSDGVQTFTFAERDSEPMQIVRNWGGPRVVH